MGRIVAMRMSTYEYDVLSKQFLFIASHVDIYCKARRRLVREDVTRTEEISIECSS